MRKRVAVYFAPGNARSVIIGKAMANGVRSDDRSVELISSLRYHEPEHQIALFYGFANGLKRVFDDYRAAGRKACYIDLGYWGRRKRSKFDGYHKISVNSRHPTDYFQRKAHDDSRFKVFDVPIRPWRQNGKNIVVVGMSGKGAIAEGFAPEQWERDAIRRLRDLTRRPVIYRPKPNWIGAQRIPGSIWMKDEPFEDVIRDAYAIVTHHSNFAVEALLEGIPCICPYGVASTMSAHQFEDIENLPRPDGRAQWASDVAWTQWSVAEMQSGAAWHYLLREGLV